MTRKRSSASHVQVKRAANWIIKKFRAVIKFRTTVFAVSAPITRVILAPLIWLFEKIYRALSHVFFKLVAIARWLVFPKGDTPFDALKPYVSLILTLIGFGALVWTGVQIAFPPIVITMTKLPSQLETESWINPEI